MQTLKFSVLLLAGAVLVAVCGGCATMPYDYDEVVVVYDPGPGGCPYPPRPPHGGPSATETAQPTPRDTPIEHGQATADTGTRTRELRPEVRVRVPRPESQNRPERVVGPVGNTFTR
ncbi:MAG: hypothetical protein ACYDIE_04535 [Candidatus Krumholzibacteriia bacterium]